MRHVIYVPGFDGEVLTHVVIGSQKIKNTMNKKKPKIIKKEENMKHLDAILFLINHGGKCDWEDPDMTAEISGKLFDARIFGYVNSIITSEESMEGYWELKPKYLKKR